VSTVFTKPYARDQEAVVPKAGGLGRVKNILAASTRQDWEADGPRLWVRKGDTKLRIVNLTDDEGRVELKEQWARSAERARLPSGWSSPSATVRSCWRRSLWFALTQAGHLYPGLEKRRTAGSWSLAGTTTFAGSSQQGSTWARTLFAPTCGRRVSS
jgi:hypothetical protein